jgi:hypothetical protein
LEAVKKLRAAAGMRLRANPIPEVIRFERAGDPHLSESHGGA